MGIKLGIKKIPNDSHRVFSSKFAKYKKAHKWMKLKQQGHKLLLEARSCLGIQRQILNPHPRVCC